MFAILIYADEGTYYYTPLEAKTLKDAEAEALEHVYERGDPEYTNWEIAQVSGTHEYHGENFRDFFRKKDEAFRIKQQDSRDRFDREQYERLRAKFERGE